MLLFSYGTLRDRDVQLANFGRELAGRPDVLPGYILRMGAEYANAIPTGNPEDAVPGVVLKLTEKEMAAADAYEEDADYRRIMVTLRSGIEAWVYIRPA